MKWKTLITNIKNDPEFKAELADLYVNYAGRPSLLYYAEKMTKDLDGAKVYIKREDLNHTGSHKINNVLGQLLIDIRIGKGSLQKQERDSTALQLLQCAHLWDLNARSTWVQRI